MSRVAVSLRVLRSREGLDDLSDDWAALAASDGSVFQSPSFGMAWLRAVGGAESARPLVVTAREGRRLVGVMPTCTIAARGLSTLTWLGGLSTVDRGGLLIQPGRADRESIATSLIRASLAEHRFRLVRLDHIRADNPDIRVFSRELVRLTSEVAPYIDLSGGLAAFHDSLSRVSRTNRSTTRRRLRQLQRAGELVFRVHEPSEPETVLVLDEFVRTKRQRLLEKGFDDSPFLKDRYADFYVDQALANPQAHTSSLSLDGRVIAVHVGYIDRAHLLWVMPAFDQEFAKFSPGRVLLYLLAEWCCENGISGIDLGHGDEPYKSAWTDLHTEISSFVSPNLIGRLFRIGYELRRKEPIGQLWSSNTRLRVARPSSNGRQPFRRANPRRLRSPSPVSRASRHQDETSDR